MLKQQKSDSLQGVGIYFWSKAILSLLFWGEESCVGRNRAEALMTREMTSPNPAGPLKPHSDRSSLDPTTDLARPSPLSHQHQGNLRSPFPGALWGRSSFHIIIAICQNKAVHKPLWVQAAGYAVTSLTNRSHRYATIILQNKS